MATQRISMWLALRCREPLFWQFLNVSDEPSAVHLVRSLCNVASRREFDRDKEAALRFHETIRKPFIEYQQDPKNQPQDQEQ